MISFIICCDIIYVGWSGEVNLPKEKINGVRTFELHRRSSVCSNSAKDFGFVHVRKLSEGFPLLMKAGKVAI